MYLFLKSFVIKNQIIVTHNYVEYIDKIINKEKIDECIKINFKIQTI